MGNAAATPISAQECAKYGISIDDVQTYNKAVSEAKKRKAKSSSSKGGGKDAASSKLDKMDIDAIHKYCLKAKKKGTKMDATNLEKILAKQLSKPEPSVSICMTSTAHDSFMFGEDAPSEIQVRAIGSDDDDDVSVLETRMTGLQIDV